MVVHAPGNADLVRDAIHPGPESDSLHGAADLDAQSSTHRHNPNAARAFVVGAERMLATRRLHAHPPELHDHRRDQPVEARRDLRRAAELELGRRGHDADDHHLVGIAIAQRGSREQVRDADLVGRQALVDRGRHVIAREADQRSGWAIAAHGVDEDHAVGRGDQREQVEPERAAVDDAHASGHRPLATHPVHGGDSRAIVAADDVAQAQHEHPDPVGITCRRRHRGSGPSAGTCSR